MGVGAKFASIYDFFVIVELIFLVLRDIDIHIVKKTLTYYLIYVENCTESRDESLRYSSVKNFWVSEYGYSTLRN